MLLGAFASEEPVTCRFKIVGWLVDPSQAPVRFVQRLLMGVLENLTFPEQSQLVRDITY